MDTGIVFDFFPPILGALWDNADRLSKAEAMRIAAEAEADANRKIAASLTDELIEKIKYEQWNGELPTVTGSTSIVSIEP